MTIHVRFFLSNSYDNYLRKIAKQTCVFYYTMYKVVNIMFLYYVFLFFFLYPHFNIHVHIICQYHIPVVYKIIIKHTKEKKRGDMNSRYG